MVATEPHSHHCGYSDGYDDVRYEIAWQLLITSQCSTIFIEIISHVGMENFPMLISSRYKQRMAYFLQAENLQLSEICDIVRLNEDELENIHKYKYNQMKYQVDLINSLIDKGYSSEFISQKMKISPQQIDANFWQDYLQNYSHGYNTALHDICVRLSENDVSPLFLGKIAQEIYRESFREQ
ncbi:hypothetical protein ACPV5G_19785 [Photobacterium damselae]|uniref:hypothetical protein n=1 Tax=Photobacterium damselae TaxID=38293 RepID=UPI004067D209